MWKVEKDITNQYEGYFKLLTQAAVLRYLVHEATHEHTVLYRNELLMTM